MHWDIEGWGHKVMVFVGIHPPGKIQPGEKRISPLFVKCLICYAVSEKPYVILQNKTKQLYEVKSGMSILLRLGEVE